MLKQLHSFIEKGFAGVAIRPSRSMVPVYLSEEFFGLFEACLEVAAKKDFSIRLADDISLPWNGAFETFARRDPSLRAHVLQLKKSELVAGSKPYQYEISNPMATEMVASRMKNGKCMLSKTMRFPQAAEKPQFAWTPAAGDWQMMVFEKVAITDPEGNAIPNVFNSKTASAYIQVLDMFRTRFSRYIPKTFAGFVTEMPAYNAGDNALPWDDDLVIRFRGKYKKDLRTLLPALFTDTIEDSAKIRYQVNELIRESMNERFAAPVELWARKFRLSQWLLTPERNISKTPTMLRDALSVVEGNFNATGIQNQEGTDENFGMLRTAADLNHIVFRRETVTVIGRNRNGTGSTLQSLKSEIDQSLLCGPSRILMDGFFFNLDHRSYLKSPLSPFWYSSEWNHMGLLTDYAGRAFCLNSGLLSVRPLAVLAPTASIVAEYTPGNDGSSTRSIATFGRVLRELHRCGVDFDIVTDEHLSKALVFSNGEFNFGDKRRKGNYQGVVVPCPRYLERLTFGLLEKLASKKGSILLVDEAPIGTIEDGITPGFAERVDRLQRSRNGHVVVAPVRDISTFLETFDTPIKALVDGKQSGDIAQSYALGEGYAVSVLMNISDKQEHPVTLELEGTKFLYLADCVTGEFHDLVSEEIDKMTIATLLVAPRQTCCIIVSDKKQIGLAIPQVVPKKKKAKSPDTDDAEPVQRNYRIVLKDQWQFTPLSFNAMPLSAWSKRIGLSRDQGGFSHLYETYFEVKEPPTTAQLSFIGMELKSEDLKGGMEINCNGNLIVPFTATPLTVSNDGVALDNTAALDHQMLEHSFLRSNVLTYDLKNFVRRGVNRLSLRMSGLAADPAPLAYPPIIAGNFSLVRGARGWIIDTAIPTVGYDSWTNHSYPYLCGIGSYKQTFEIPGDYQRLRLRFSKVSGTAWVIVNGHKLGGHHWQPLEIDITELCQSKRNEVEVHVCSTLDSILRMTPQPSGLLGEAYVDVY